MSPLQAARNYDRQRERVMHARRGSRRHKCELSKLSAYARTLHAAERAAGIPLGSTRELSARDRRGEIR